MPKMQCPHCRAHSYVHVLPLMWKMGPQNHEQQLSDVEARWSLSHATCPGCDRVIIWLYKTGFDGKRLEYLVRPKGISRPPLPAEVPPEYAEDYNEACLVLADSPKASAALSRRCLQALLRDKAGTTSRDLAKQIEDVLGSKSFPSQLADALDYVRHIGNFAAHAIKSKSTGEIIEVEPGEAEWNLDVLEGLFDFYFVQPRKWIERKKMLNEKLREAGKPPMKEADEENEPV